MERYRERAISHYPLWRMEGFTVKPYSILYENEMATDEDWQMASQLAAETLLPGKGVKAAYLIFHKGKDCNYIVVSQWSDHNMLRMFAYRSEKEEPKNYRDVTASGLSICVWDMQIHYHERNAYVRHILSDPENMNLTSYYEDVYNC